MPSEVEHLPGDIFLGLQTAKKRKYCVRNVDYTKCVLCQTHKSKTAYNIKPGSFKKLKHAVDARQDETALLLQSDAEKNDWLMQKEPKWHPEKSIKFAKKKCLKQTLVKTSEDQTDSPGTSNSSQRSTRLSTPIFQPKSMCVICNNVWLKGKLPTSKVSTKNSQHFILNRAKQLNRDDILLQMIGQGHDMVANDICYHTPCMNKFKVSRIPKGKSTTSKLYETAFSCLIELNKMMIPSSSNLKDTLSEHCERSSTALSWKDFEQRNLTSTDQTH